MSSLNKTLQTNAGYIAGLIVESPFVQAFLGLLVYGSIAFVLMFTDAGERITGDLLDLLLGVCQLVGELV
ncbi:hypothetical protein AmDm5_0717 [Acetobacter malorum]|uniref:Uncharacterized protein n=1 Tax=Acetobacter malorum TaxID=178901 RepID=A0A087PTR6_9PROT|nr:hypothetical protein [Acetobacter malorum]KFL90769.1 hypothetical protein AmDm5_0717 [Acetobacter malorum]OAG78037.1 hypothetical protein Amal_00653 [Acetobacter malorum]